MAVLILPDRNKLIIPRFPCHPDRAYVEGNAEKQFKDAHPEYHGPTEEDILNSDGIPVLYIQWLYGPRAGPRTLSLVKARVLGATGRRGEGKTKTLSLWIAKKLAVGDPVWSNVAVKYYLNDGFDNLKLCETKPLDMVALGQLEAELTSGVVAISELQYFADSRNSNSTKNKLINSAIFQVRKRALSFYFDCKYLTWVDVRIRFELDTEFHCQDFAHTTEGIDKEIPEGITTLHEIKDLEGWSGEVCSLADSISAPPQDYFESKGRGYEGHFGPQPIYAPGIYKQQVFDRLVWNIYKTNDVVNASEIYAGVEMIVDKRRVDVRHNKDEDEDAPIQRRGKRSAFDAFDN